jgi:hypothetical protein
MVRAILEGRKTQTRRPVNILNGWEPLENDGKIVLGRCMDDDARPHQKKFGVIIRCPFDTEKGLFQHDVIPCPFGKPGDLLWVRETWRAYELRCEDGIQFRVDMAVSHIPDSLDENAALEFCNALGVGDSPRKGMRKPSIHMPRWASRITLRIKSVRVQRVQDISEADAIAEGFPNPDGTNRDFPDRARYWFKTNWQFIYKNWDANPWVWAIEFERVESEGQP